MTAFNRIDHFIVMMLENRSFDHVLGFMRTPGYPIDGLQGDESNAANPNDAASPRYTVTRDAAYSDPPLDPGHSFNPAAVTQMFGLSKTARQELTWFPDMPPANNGYVYDYQQRVLGNPADIMKCFAPERLPVLTTLAREFAVCDKWFSSAPGATCPNRRFVHSATSDGYLGGTQKVSASRTIFELLKTRGLGGTVYFHDVPQSLTMLSLLAHAKFKPIKDFWNDLERGALPHYTFIEPRYFNYGDVRANDQHPSNDMHEGEKLIASIYNAVRCSTLWEKTAIVITYDESGGTYDHAPAPKTVNPDGKIGQDDDEDGKLIKFNFDRLGARVPAIVISPLIPRMTIDSRVHDHTAILALLEKRFGLPALTERDKWAADNDLSSLFSLSEPRTDTPRTITPASDHAAMSCVQTSLLNGLQSELVEAAAALVEHDDALNALRQRALASREQSDAVIYLDEVLRRADVVEDE